MASPIEFANVAALEIYINRCFLGALMGSEAAIDYQPLKLTSTILSSDVSYDNFLVHLDSLDIWLAHITGPIFYLRFHLPRLDSHGREIQTFPNDNASPQKWKLPSAPPPRPFGF
ncbi:hypothetical protein C0995_016503 [Termitomyces sp. Mi166|nr:hypothetical protein C0995_016503 [Termitomyces sp. Mi166\